jgi:hypothetical protein
VKSPEAVWFTHPCARVEEAMEPEPVKGVVYELVIEGELGDRFAQRFDGLELRRCQGTTILTGRLIDQAQLSGVLTQIQELGLELVSVDQPERRGAGDAASASSAVTLPRGGQA